MPRTQRHVRLEDFGETELSRRVAVHKVEVVDTRGFRPALAPR